MDEYMRALTKYIDVLISSYYNRSTTDEVRDKIDDVSVSLCEDEDNGCVVDQEPWWFDAMAHTEPADLTLITC